MVVVGYLTEAVVVEDLTVADLIVVAAALIVDLIVAEGPHEEVAVTGVAAISQTSAPDLVIGPAPTLPAAIQTLPGGTTATSAIRISHSTLMMALAPALTQVDSPVEEEEDLEIAAEVTVALAVTVASEAAIAEEIVEVSEGAMTTEAGRSEVGLVAVIVTVAVGQELGRQDVDVVVTDTALTKGQN